MEVKDIGIKGELDDMLKALGSGHLVDDKVDDLDKDSDKDKDTDKDLNEDTDKDLDTTIVDDDLDKDTDKDEPIPDEKDKIIEDLRLKLAEKDKAIVDKKEVIEPPKDDPLILDEQDFIGDEDLDDVVRDKSMFNKLLNSVYTKGVEDARRLTSEKVLLSIPDIVKNVELVDRQLRKMSDEFYETNKDLVPFKKVVAVVFEELASQNPDRKYNEVLDLVALEVRERLELHKKVDKENKSKDGKPPRLPAKKGGQRQSIDKPEISPLQAELDEMNKVIRR